MGYAVRRLAWPRGFLLPSNLRSPRFVTSFSISLIGRPLGKSTSTCHKQNLVPATPGRSRLSAANAVSLLLGR